MNKQPTHTGIVDTIAGESRGTERRIKLRETKRYWITESGVKFKKTGSHNLGSQVPFSMWNRYHLKLDSIKSLDNAGDTV